MALSVGLYHNVEMKYYMFSCLPLLFTVMRVMVIYPVNTSETQLISFLSNPREKLIKNLSL